LEAIGQRYGVTNQRVHQIKKLMLSREAAAGGALTSDRIPA
jgi:DNA-directed RNA polymerase sigma subunit (sigma70/sigma32)